MDEHYIELEKENQELKEEVQDLKNKVKILDQQLQQYCPKKPSPPYVSCRQAALFKNRLIF